MSGLALDLAGCSGRGGRGRTFAYDLEIYPNYFLAVFKEVRPGHDGALHSYAWDELNGLRRFAAQEALTLVGYNNFTFDDPLLRMLTEGEIQSLKELHDVVTKHFNASKENPSPLREATYQDSTWACVDLMQILGGPTRAGSLKSHQVRLAMPSVQDLPFAPGKDLTDEEKEIVRRYCENDVNATERLYFDCLDVISTRRKVNEQYPYLGQSALRRSNASIAEAVLKQELTLRAGFKRITYIAPPNPKFDPSRHTSNDIRFAGAANSDVLERLRAQSPFTVAQWRDELCERFVFVLGEHQLPLTAGGLHTKNPPLLLRSGAILEFDVSSYYPSLLRKFNRSPAGLPDKWIEIVNELTDKRLELKARGEKAAADVHKIIINSIYGKLGDEFSINRDDSLLLQVVVNGQLYLMMLMERFAEAGFQVIAANTDGIFIDAAHRVAEAQEIAAQWTKDTGFNLESKISTAFVALSVNDYALHEDKRGWFHKKGAFGVGKRTHPTIIAEAVLHAISSGEPPDAFIRRSANIFDFLYSTTAAGSGFTLKHGDAVLQKTNRWYKSTDGTPIERITKRASGEIKSTKVANSDNCRIANVLDTADIPPDLDRGYYVRGAENLLADLKSGQTPGSVTRLSLIEVALKAKEKGFVVVPKGLRGKEKASVQRTFDQDTIDYWRGADLAEADWGEFEGFGAYTGKDFNLVGIDVDDPDKAKKAELYERIPPTSMVAYHGARGAADVREGRRRGTFLFNYEGDALRTTAGQFLKDYGFEVLYGKKVVQLAGYHPSREPYRYAGSLRKIPAPLLSVLEWTVPEREESSTPPGPTSPEGIIDLLTAFQEAANKDSEYLTIGGSLTFATSRDDKVHLKGLCVGHAQHTNRENDQRMTVTVWRGRIKVACFHQSCEAMRRRWEERLHLAAIAVRKPTIKPERLVITEAMEEVAGALRDPSPAKLILAPTGSGKSYGIANYVAPFLDANSGNSDKFAIICSTKDEMKQIGEKFSDILDTDNINQYGIDLIEASKALYVKNARSISSVAKGTRVAITHYTYVSRRKFSPHYYTLLKFIDENTHVFVDEFDAFVDSQTAHLPLGSRWRPFSQGGITKYVQLRKCGMFHGFNNCLKCVMRKYDGYRLTLDNFNNPTYQPVEEFTEGEAKPTLAHIAFDGLVQGKVLVGSNEVWMLNQTDDPGELRFAEKEPIDYAATFVDHINAAYLPTVHRPVILYKGSEISREELVRRYTSLGSGELDIPEAERKELQFPSRPCNALTVTVIDRRPLAKMSRAKSFTALTATLTPLREGFLTDAIPDLKKIVIHPKTDRKMDRIVIVGMSRQIPVTALTRGLWKIEGKMLRFRETEAAARRDYDELKGSSIVTKMGISKREYWGSSEQSDDHRVLLTYSFGSLGRGIDFGQYDTVSVNGAIYKPISAYVTDDPAVLRDQIDEDRSKMLTQNIGRILRRPAPGSPAVKIVVLEEIESREAFDLVVREMQPMSNEPVVSWWVPEFLSTEEVCDWLTRVCSDRSLPKDVPTGVSDIVSRAKSLVDQGCSKKELKQKLRWTTTRKRIDKEEVSRIEAELNNLLARRPRSVRRTALNTPAKVEAKRQGRARKIRELIQLGKTDGQIRGNMKVNDKKQGWDDADKQWFEEVLAEEREKSTGATAKAELEAARSSEFSSK